MQPCKVAMIDNNYYYLCAAAGSEVDAGGRGWTFYVVSICGVGMVILGVWYKRRGGKNKRMKLV